MICSLIAAVSKNNVIGNKGRIPWNIPEDRFHFKNITMNHIVIFGRKTFEEIGAPLPGRINIVVSATKNFKSENLFTAKNLDNAIELAEKLSVSSSLQFPVSKDEFFICGGQQLYEKAINFADKLYLTRIDESFDGDTFFPELNKNQFRIIEESEIKNQNGCNFQFLEYQKIL